MIQLIACMSRNRVIGRENAMPWHLPTDLRRFRALTTGTAVIMGRKTFESIGHPLPNRFNIVMSRSEYIQHPKVWNAKTAEGAVKLAMDNGYYREHSVIGGGEIYRQFLPYASRIYLTVIDKDFEGDTTFPEFESDPNWALERDSGWMEENGLRFKFLDYINLSKPY